MSETREIRIEYVELGALKKFPENPKDHDLGEIGAAYDDRGYVTPAVVDERSGFLVEGHGRLEQLEVQRDAGKPAPLGIRVKGKKWYIPVVRGVRFKNMDQARRHVVGANKIAERGGWRKNTAAFLGKIKTGGLKGSGVRDKELVRFLAQRRGVGEEDIPAVPPAQAHAKRGDLWQLGDHRLLCGDSFSKDDRSRLLGRDEVAMILMDPPYAIYGSSTGLGSDVADDKMVVPFFTQLCQISIETVKVFGHVYVCCDWRSWSALWEGAKRARLSPKNCLIWDKGGSGLGSNYANTYEQIGFFSRLPPQKIIKSKEQTGQRMVHASNMLRYPRPAGDERQHNAAKPVPMLAELIGHSSDKGEAVVDFFAGSGSTMIAAQKTERRARIMEIEPRMCDVIVARFEKLSGTKAKLLA